MDRELVVVGVDPHAAKPYSWAAWRRDGRSETLLLARYGALVELYGDVKTRFTHLGGCSLVAVEDQFMSRNYKVAKQLSWAAGKVAGAMEILGCPYEFVNVAKWQSYFGFAGKSKDRHLWQEAKKSCGSQWRDCWEGNEDVGAAILIGLYALRIEWERLQRQ